MKLVLAALLSFLPGVLAAQESPADLMAAAKAHYDASRFRDALATYEQARAAAEAANDPLVAARAKLGIASLKTMYGRFDEGIALAREAQATFESARDAHGLAGAFQHLGNLHIGAGKFAEAEGYFRQCAAIPDPARRPFCIERLGQCQGSLGRYREAMSTFRVAIDAAIAANDRKVQAGALAGIGSIYLDQGNAELSVEYLRKAIAMFRELGNTAMLSATLNNLGITWVLTGRLDRALEVYRENLALLEGLKYTRGVNVSKMNIAAVLIDLGRYDEAEQILDELLPVYERTDDPNARANVRRHLATIDARRGNLSAALEHAQKALAERSDDIKDVYLSRALAGHVYRKLGRAGEARTALAGAIEAIESMHGHSTGGEVHFFDERYAAYAEMAILLISEGRIDDALTYTERYRSRVLMNILRDQRGALQPATARDVASRLPRDTALIEYLVTEDKTYAFVIADGSVAVREIDVDRAALAKEAESFRALLADRRPDFRRSARSLHQTLIAPIADLVSRRRSWILIPDGPLWSLPFQALLDPRGTYVAEQAAIVYAPSIAAWMEMSNAPRAESASARRELLAFGNPTRPTSAGVEGARNTLAPLPEAEAEVRSAAKFYGAASAVYVRDEATEERFKKEAARYRVLHVAGHGVLNDASPMQSYLLLAAGDGRTEDGFLEAGELMKMDLGADLVVLSACDTARGKYAAGEGIIGFSWALFAARCRTQVVSQWKVDSAATRVLMRDFHKHVRTDHTRAAAALQKTIVSMLETKQYRHPFYWAGFVVMGDGL